MIIHNMFVVEKIGLGYWWVGGGGKMMKMMTEPLGDELSGSDQQFNHS